MTFTATPAAGYTFTGWTGYGCADSSPCTVTIGPPGTLVANFTTGFSPSDLTGTWYFLGLADSTTMNDPYWSWATLTLNGAGAVTSGTYSNSFGQTGALTPGSFEIDSAGVVFGSVTTAAGSMVLSGKLDVHKGILPMLTAEPLRPGLGMALKGGGSFSTADLAGTWIIEDFGDTVDMNEPSSTLGTITLDISGNGSGSVTPSGSSPIPVSGSFSIDSAGVVTGSINAGGDTVSFPHGKLDVAKTILALVRTGSDNRGLTVLTKSGGSFSLADLAGTWYVFNRSDGLSSNDPYLSGAMVTLNASGAVIGGAYFNSFNVSGIITGGSLTIDPSGAVHGSVTKVENGSSGTITFPHGKMAPNKTMVVMASSEPGYTGQILAIKGVSTTPSFMNLTVTKQGTGTGTVTSNPPGINCGVTCSAPFGTGSSVTLTATAVPGSAFTGWSGESCTGTGSCTVSMTQARTVTASFSLTSYILSISVGGSSGGTVTATPGGLTCTGACAASYTNGTVVTLTASDGPGGSFREWRGACTGAGSCQVTMSGARAVTAVFSKTFTDATLTPQVTPIKVVHFTDLRAAITTLRAHYSLAAFPWTDPSLTPGSTPVKRLHLTDLRTALNQVYTAAGRAAPTYTDPSITAGQTLIKASHLSELRTYVHGLE